MGNKRKTVFIGVYTCPSCGNITTYYAVPEQKPIPFIFALTGMPLSHTVRKKASCSICGYQRKIKGELKEAYNRALENRFDEDNIVKEFLSIVEETCITYNVVMDNQINEVNLENATTEIYNIYGLRQGYERNYYKKLCEVFAWQAETKLKKYNLMFRS